MAGCGLFDGLLHSRGFFLWSLKCWPHRPVPAAQGRSGKEACVPEALSLNPLRPRICIHGHCCRCPVTGQNGRWLLGSAVPGNRAPRGARVSTVGVGRPLPCLPGGQSVLWADLHPCSDSTSNTCLGDCKNAKHLFHLPHDAPNSPTSRSIRSVIYSQLFVSLSKTKHSQKIQFRPISLAELPWAAPASWRWTVLGAPICHPQRPSQEVAAFPIHGEGPEHWASFALGPGLYCPSLPYCPLSSVPCLRAQPCRLCRVLRAQPRGAPVHPSGAHTQSFQLEDQVCTGVGERAGQAGAGCGGLTAGVTS